MKVVVGTRRCVFSSAFKMPDKKIGQVFQPMSYQPDQLAGGYFSNFGKFESMWSQGCASEIHIFTFGLNKLGSSRLEAVTPWPCSLSPPKSREPHSGQKPRLL